MEQRIRFCTSKDGTRIAYSAIGSGPPLVKAATWLGHLQFDFDSPVFRHWTNELARYHTYIRYDDRGCGLSDREVKSSTFNDWIDDLEAVVDSMGLDKFALLGMSHGGALSIAYAARHPERVSHLILYGSSALGRGRTRVGLKDLRELRAWLTLTKVGWGKGNPAYEKMFTSIFMPDGKEEEMRWFTELQGKSTSPENAANFINQFVRIDVRNLLPKISVPTLILHSRGDLVLPFEQGRELATRIKDAHFVPLNSRNHILMEDEEAWTEFLTEVRKFLGIRGTTVTASVGRDHSEHNEIQGERRLAAIMFTDTVGYTALTQNDERMALQLLEKQRELVRPVVSRHHGREVKTMGDGSLIEFASALEATECAVEIQQVLGDHNKTSEYKLSVRIGIHVGDVIHAGKDVYGDAVNIAARIEPLAEPGGVCVSGTVFDQVRNKISKSLMKLEPRSLKNVSYPVDIYEIVMRQ